MPSSGFPIIFPVKDASSQPFELPVVVTVKLNVVGVTFPKLGDRDILKLFPPTLFSWTPGGYPSTTAKVAPQPIVKSIL